MVRPVVVLALVLGLAGVRPAEAEEPLVPEARSGTFSGSPRGFFVCTYTQTSPVETPDCFLGYVVPAGQAGQGRLRAVGSGFQRSSNFTVLAYALAAGGADASTVFPVEAARGTLSRHQASEEVSLYQPPQPVHCFAYFIGRTSGAWRMSHPHSAGHRRFDEPPPDPRTPGDR